MLAVSHISTVSPFAGMTRRQKEAAALALALGTRGGWSRLWRLLRTEGGARRKRA